MVHILLVPALILGLIAAHLALVVYHKHTQFPGPGRTEGNVVGYPVFPVYAAKAGGFFFIVFGVITLMGALMQINPVWVFGPYNPAEVTAGSQPDWYMGFVEGAHPAHAELGVAHRLDDLVVERVPTRARPDGPAVRRRWRSIRSSRPG